MTLLGKLFKGKYYHNTHGLLSFYSLTRIDMDLARCIRRLTYWLGTLRKVYPRLPALNLILRVGHTLSMN
jgi:hypothetical protein